jgi:hypothetical protein
MTNKTTGSRILVSMEGSAGPYIRLPYNQLDEIKQVLDSHGIPYGVNENIISLSGGPFMAVVTLGRGVDARSVQAILDNVH